MIRENIRETIRTLFSTGKSKREIARIVNINIKTVRNMLTTTLTTIIEVIGINIFPFSDSILISPGSFPNQFRSPGAKCNIAPMASNIPPAIIIQRAIFLQHQSSK